MKVAVKGSVSGTETYLSKKTGLTVVQLYVDVHKLMLQVECDNAEEFAQHESVICVGELSVYNREFKLRSALVRASTQADDDYFAGADIQTISSALGAVKPLPVKEGKS